MKTTPIAYRMCASFRRHSSEKSIARLLAELRSALPASQLSEETTDGDPAVRLLWEHPCDSAYGPSCLATWKTFQVCVRRAFGPDADEDLYGVAFGVYDGEERVGRISRSEDAGGIRDYLAGQPLHCGDGIDLLMPDGAWLSGRYELGAAAHDDQAALFFFNVWGGQGHLPIRDAMVLRLPLR